MVLGRVASPSHVYIKTPKSPRMRNRFPHRPYSKKIKSKINYPKRHSRYPKTSSHYHVAIMNSAKHALNYVSESIQGAASSSSKEVNKSIARDPNVRASTR